MAGNHIDTYSKGVHRILRAGLVRQLVSGTEHVLKVAVGEVTTFCHLQRAMTYGISAISYDRKVGDAEVSRPVPQRRKPETWKPLVCLRWFIQSV